MRTTRFYLLAAAGILAFSLPCLPVYAVGDVLVPSDDDNSSSQTKHQSDSPALPALDPSEAAPTPLNYSPIPEAGTEATPAANGANATHIIKIPTPGAESIVPDPNRPNNFKIEIASKNAWGAADAASIQHSLGISPADVPKRCHLSIGGMMQNDAGVYAFESGTRSFAIAHYGGNIGTVTVRMQALCDIVPLPPNAGYVTQIEDKYSVFLVQSSCAPPHVQAENLFVQYNGDGEIRCTYQ